MPLSGLWPTGQVSPGEAGLWRLLCDAYDLSYKVAWRHWIEGLLLNKFDDMLRHDRQNRLRMGLE
jgi:hypothetical protein